jgi:hypothetical protein
MTLRRRLAFATVTALGAAGCALILGIDDKPLRQPVEAGPDPCEHHVPPSPPDKDDDELTRKRYTLALRSVDVGTTDAGLLGFDLDNSCTCVATGGAHDAAPACATKTAPPEPPVACDGVGGIDSAFNGIATVQSALQGGLQNQEVECGRRTMLVIISNYNGLANDKEVQLAMVITPGIQTAHDAGEPPSGCNGPGQTTVYAPHWDGTDVWSSNTDFVVKGTREPKLAAKGFVKNWTLVIHASGEEAFTVPVGPVTMEAHQTTIVGQIEPLDEAGSPLDPQAPGTRASTIKLRGQVAGRVAITEMLKGLQNVEARVFNGFLCPGNLFYDSIKNTLCASLDVMTSAAQDFTGGDCDGISIAVAFRAEPALMDEARLPMSVSPSPCPTVTKGCE